MHSRNDLVLGRLLLVGGGADVGGVAAGVSATCSGSVILLITLLERALGSVPVYVLWHRCLQLW